MSINSVATDVLGLLRSISSTRTPICGVQAIRPTFGLIGCCFVASFAVTSAHAQWVVTNLHPAATSESVARSITGTKQAGYAVIGGNQRAGIWSGTAASWIDLNPAGASSSDAYATTDTQQAGFAVIGGSQRASIWSGTAASWINLNPAGATESHASATTGTLQAGSATFGAVRHAGIWSGTAASWVDLHPAGATGSAVSSTTNTRQAGAAVFGAPHAGIWSSTAASWIDLNPAGASESAAYATTGTQQAGYAIVGGIQRAGIWNGTAASWVDLHPAGFTRSRTEATDGTRQAGFAMVGGRWHAGIWSGTAASWEDLSTVLMGSWGDTYAAAIWSDGTALHVAGYGYSNDRGRYESLLWTKPQVVWTGVYDPSLGTLPQAQGWTQYDYYAASPPVSVVAGELLQGPTSVGAAQFWTRPIASCDFTSARGLVVETELLVVSSGRDAVNSGWSVELADVNRRLCAVGVYDGGIFIFSNGLGSTFFPMTLPPGYNIYRVAIGSGSCSVSINGHTRASLPVGPTQNTGNAPNTLNFGDNNPLSASQTRLRSFRWGTFATPFASAGPNDNAAFSGTRPDPGVSGPPTTLTFNSLTLEPGSNFTLGSNETLNLNNGTGTLYIQPGSVFCGNGVILGNVVNAGLAKIPITRAGLVYNIQGGTVIIVTPPVTTLNDPPLVVPNPPSGDPPRVQPGTMVGIGMPGAGGSPGSGGPGTPGFSYPGHAVIDSPSFTVAGTIAWDSRLDVTGSYEQTATGVLRMYIADDVQGETYSYVHVGTTASIDGKLQIVLRPELFNHLARAGDSFDFITAVGGLTLAPGFNVQTLITAQGAAFLGLSLPRFDSGFENDWDQLVSLPQNLFSYSIVDGGTTLRVTMTQSVDCPAPAAPASILTCPNQSSPVSLTVSPASPAPSTFTWQYRGAAGQLPADWIDLSNGPNDIGGGASLSITGATTTTLGVLRVPGVWPINGIDAGGFIRCIVTNTCGSVTSDAATLSICPADINCSGAITVQDIFDFLAAYFAGDPTGDFNASGSIGVQDIFDFLAAYFAGCA